MDIRAVYKKKFSKNIKQTQKPGQIELTKFYGYKLSIINPDRMDWIEYT